MLISLISDRAALPVSNLPLAHTDHANMGLMMICTDIFFRSLRWSYRVFIPALFFPVSGEDPGHPPRPARTARPLSPPLAPRWEAFHTQKPAPAGTDNNQYMVTSVWAERGTTCRLTEDKEPRPFIYMQIEDVPSHSSVWLTFWTNVEKIKSVLTFKFCSILQPNVDCFWALTKTAVLI